MNGAKLILPRDLTEIKNFIWDFDGTLYDTYGYTIECFCRAVRECGETADEAKVYELMMNNIGAAFSWYCSEKGIDPEALRAAYSRIKRRDPVSTGGPFPYAKELLKLIVQRGGGNYMFTHRSADLYPLMEYWETDRDFEGIVTMADGFPAKPAPDAVKHLLQKYALDPRLTVMVGDREMDIASGANAGVLTCHVTNNKPYKNFECDLRVGSLHELYAALGGKCV